MTIHLFPTNVLVEDHVVTQADASAIRNYIIYRDRQQLTVKHEDMFTDPLTEQLCPPLCATKEVFITLFHRLLCTYDNTAKREQINLSTCKYNMMSAGERRPIHMHRQIDGYAVLYLDDCSEQHGGQLVLHDPKFTDSPFSSKPYYTVQPEVGRVVVAPAYLWHEVNTYYGTEPRVALVVNCTVGDK